MIVISTFSMFQEVSLVLFFMNVISMFFMFQEVYFCTVLYNCNFYVLYVPGSLFLYCSLWMQFLFYLCSRKVIFVLFFIIVISMFSMFQEVYFCTVLYDCNFYVLYVPGSVFCTVLYDFNFYVLYVPGSLLLYYSLWL
jgi:hypothetical protein